MDAAEDTHAFCILKTLKPVLITVPSSTGVTAVNNMKVKALKFKPPTNWRRFKMSQHSLPHYLQNFIWLPVKRTI
jgi:hypothetical protein